MLNQSNLSRAFHFFLTLVAVAVAGSGFIPGASADDQLIGPQINGGSFETIDPSDAPVQAGPRRASKIRTAFNIPGWTLKCERGFAGVDGQRPTTDGKRYLFANSASVLSAQSAEIKNLQLVHGDGLQLRFQMAGRHQGTAVVKIAYQLNGVRWEAGQREINLSTPDRFFAQEFLHRLPVDANQLSLILTVDTANNKRQQVLLDSIELTRIAAKDLPPLPTEFYVATDGNDANPGTLRQPFRTIQKAADVAGAGVTVFIRSGVYEEQVKLSSSGFPNRPIVFRPYRQEKVIVSTADRITDWQQVKGDINGDGRPDPGIWVAQVGKDAGGKSSRNTLFANEQVRFEAKHFAESDPLDFANWGKIKRGDLSFTQLKSDQLKGGPPNFWAGATVRHHTTDWSSFDSKIKSYDPNTGTLQFADRLGYLINHKQDLGFYIFDSIKTLDKPGEWFKTKAGKLYYYPVKGESPNRARIAFKRREFTFDVRGLRHITIDGLTLQGGAVWMSDNNSHIRLVNAKLYGYGKGAYGTYRFRGDHSSIENCEIHHVFEAALVVNGSFHRFVNNYFHDITYTIGQRSMTMAGHSHLFSYNTFYRFARNALGVFPFRSEFSYNVFERGGMLSWDTAVFDGDVNNGDGGGCVLHHNVFRNCPTNGSYFAIYSGVDLVFHHNLLYNMGPEHRHRGQAQCMRFYHNTFVGATPQGLRSGSSQPFRSSYCNNIQLNDEKVKSLGVEFRGNYNHGRRDFVNPRRQDFRLSKQSGAIDRGIVLPGINDGYNGKAPDAGALEFGEKLWKVGHDFKNPPDIEYRWKTIAGMNLDDNGQFEVGAPAAWMHIGEPRLFDGNTWNARYRGLSPTGGRSYEIEPGEGIERVFEVKPSTHYQISVDARLVGERIRLVDFDNRKGQTEKKKHRAEEYVFGLDQGEWLMFKNIDFGDGNHGGPSGSKFNQAELLFSRRDRESSKSDAKSSALEMRIDSPTGPLLGTFRYRASVSENWYVSILKDLTPVSGKHDVYLVAKGRSAGKMYLARLRMLNSDLPDENSLAVVTEQSQSPPQVSFVGQPHWKGDYESYQLVTGSDSDRLKVTLRNAGEFTAYVDRFALVEVAAPTAVDMSIRQPDGGGTKSVARLIGVPKQPQKVGHIRLAMARKTGKKACSLRVRAWTVPSINDPDAPHDQKRFVFWEKTYRRTWDAEQFDLILKGTDEGDQRGVPLNSQPVGMMTVEISPSDQWELKRLDAVGDGYTDLVRTDGFVENDKSTWSCTFTQSINIGEIRARLPNSRTIPNTIVELKDERGRIVWKKKYRKGQNVDWTGCLLIDGSTIADPGRVRLGSVLAHSLHITTPQLRECAYRDVEVRDQADAPPAKNFALRSRAVQSSDLYGDRSLASAANNAVLQPFLDFTSTDNEKNPWLDLILEKPSTVSQIVLYNRGDADKRIGNFRVSAVNPEGKTVWAEDYSYKKGHLANGKSLTINKQIRNVKKVRIQINGKTHLHLAEVFIWGK